MFVFLHCCKLYVKNRKKRKVELANVGMSRVINEKYGSGDNE